MGLLIPILTGFLQKNFAFIKEAPYIGIVIMLLPSWILQSDRWLFGVLLSGFVAIIICKNLLRFLSVASIAYFSERTLHHLRKAVFWRFLQFGKQYFDSTNVGHHSNLLIDFTRLSLRPLQTIDKFMNSIFSLMVFLGVMVGISWRLTLIALPLFFLLNTFVRFTIVNIKKLSYVIADRGAALGKKSVEILSTIPLVKSYHAEGREQQHYTQISHEKATLDFRARMVQELIQPMQEIVSLVTVAIIFIGALYWFGRDHIATAPALIVYFYVVLNASSRFGTLSGFRGTLAAASGPLEEVLRIFDDRDKYFVHSGVSIFPGLSSEISCSHLTFSYIDRDVLKDVSFIIPRGKMTAIVGPTGAGKSTLINLLMRYYDCPERSIMIDGNDLRTFTLASYLKHVALVSQETLLLHDSLRKNITYGLDHVPTESIVHAVERARLADFVAKLPHGLDTLIGDRGVKLSGGEKQRVSIARALLKGAEILILDEATSSLDSATEKLIQEAIDDAVAGRTAIVIAHRLSTIRNADHIIVLDEGRIVEQGTHEALLQKRGLFHTLWEEQRF